MPCYRYRRQMIQKLNQFIIISNILMLQFYICMFIFMDYVIRKIVMYLWIVLWFKAYTLYYRSKQKVIKIFLQSQTSQCPIYFLIFFNYDNNNKDSLQLFQQTKNSIYKDSKICKTTTIIMIHICPICINKNVLVWSIFVFIGIYENI